VTAAFALSVHAERLHEDAVWDRTSTWLRAVERRGGRATLFVSPLRAVAGRFDLAARLHDLARRGHEIAQHTHYYAPAPEAAGPAFEKRTVLDPENVVRCLAADHAALEAAGMRPRGFVSGGWAIDPAIASWLHAAGFAYDASRRSFRLAYRSPAAEGGGGCGTAVLRADGLVELPTTAPLARALHAAVVRRTGRAGFAAMRYDLVYLHDYDLLDGGRRLTAHALVRLRPASVTAGELAARVRAALDPGAGRRGAA